MFLQTIVSAALASTAAPATTTDKFGADMTADDAVKCYSLHKFTLAQTQADTDLFNRLALRSTRWGIIVMGIFPQIDRANSADMMNARIRLADAEIELEMLEAQRDAKRTGTKQMMFDEEFRNCDLLMANNASLFTAVDDLIRAQMKNGATSDAAE